MFVAALSLFLVCIASIHEASSASIGSNDATNKVLSEIVHDVEEATNRVHKINRPQQQQGSIDTLVPRWLHKYCNGRPQRQYRDPSRCDGGFIACGGGGLAYRVDCPSGLWYDPKGNRCDAPSNVQCTLFPKPTAPSDLNVTTTPTTWIDVFCKGKKDRNYNDPDRCDGFIACSNGRAYKMDCPLDLDGTKLWYKFETDSCEYKKDVKCTLPPLLTQRQENDSMPPNEDFCKGKKSRNYVDPSRCDGFIACSNGIPHKMDCPEHLWYDVKTDKCDYPQNVNCKCTVCKSCEITWEKVGCFKDSFRTNADRVFPNQLVNYRDPHSNSWNGVTLDWKAYPQSIHALACACAEKAKANGWEYFGLQFYGECWSGPSLLPDRDGSSNQCIGNNFKTCDDSSESECVGKQFTNYVYKIKPSTPWKTCKRNWEKVGCLKDSFRTNADRVFPNQLVNYRDPHSNSWNGVTLDWKAYPQSIHALACACAEKAKANGWEYFGLQFYGECWSGPSLLPDRDGSSSQCIGNNFKSCDDSSESECIGKQFTNYVYKLKPTNTIVVQDESTSKRSMSWSHALCMGKPARRYADPLKCNGFIVHCIGGITINMNCPRDLMFNERTLQCDQPKNVNCQVLPKPQYHDEKVVISK